MTLTLTRVRRTASAALVGALLATGTASLAAAAPASDPASPAEASPTAPGASSPADVADSGWVQRAGVWYYLDEETGSARTGWLRDGGTWYYLKSSGAMATGWVLDGATWYYLKSSGAMATGSHTVDGALHLFSASGAWLGAGSTAEYTLAQFMRAGIVHWQGYKFSYYSQQVLPGGGLKIPGRHVNADGYVSDGSGYIVLAAPRGVAHGTVYSTPFGYTGKVYDTCGNCSTSPMWLDVYIR